MSVENRYEEHEEHEEHKEKIFLHSTRVHEVLVKGYSKKGLGLHSTRVHEVLVKGYSKEGMDLHPTQVHKVLVKGYSKEGMVTSDHYQSDEVGHADGGDFVMLMQQHEPSLMGYDNWGLVGKVLRQR